MTLVELRNAIATLGLPYAYGFFRSKTSCPKIVYDVDEYQIFGADNRSGEQRAKFTIDLYTATKDATSEALVENALKDVYYTKSLTFNDEEQCYVTEYRI